MPMLYRSNTDYHYHNSEQAKTVGQEPVEMEKDGWVESQLAAGNIVEVAVEKTAKPAKKDQGE